MMPSQSYMKQKDLAQKLACNAWRCTSSWCGILGRIPFCTEQNIQANFCPLKSVYIATIATKIIILENKCWQIKLGKFIYMFFKSCPKEGMTFQNCVFSQTFYLTQQKNWHPHSRHIHNFLQLWAEVKLVDWVKKRFGKVMIFCWTWFTWILCCTKSQSVPMSLMGLC